MSYSAKSPFATHITTTQIARGHRPPRSIQAQPNHQALKESRKTFRHCPFSYLSAGYTLRLRLEISTASSTRYHHPFLENQDVGWINPLSETSNDELSVAEVACVETDDEEPMLTTSIVLRLCIRFFSLSSSREGRDPFPVVI